MHRVNSVGGILPGRPRVVDSLVPPVISSLPTRQQTVANLAGAVCGSFVSPRTFRGAAILWALEVVHVDGDVPASRIDTQPRALLHDKVLPGRRLENARHVSRGRQGGGGVIEHG
jgi:hypothetical protein